MDTKKLIEILSLKRARIVDDEILASCPFEENHPSGDRHPSWALNTKKLVYFCFSCREKGTLEELLVNKLGISYGQAFDLIDELGASRIVFDEVKKKENVFIPEAMMGFFERVDEFTYSGIIDGYDCWVYPVRDKDGSLRGAIARSKTGRWHKNLWGLRKSEEIFGADSVSVGEEIVICEGPGDAIALKKIGINAVAIMGCVMHEKQQEILLSLSSSFVLWLDKDAAGFSGTKQCIASFDNVASVRYVDTKSLLSTEKDPRDVVEGRGADAARALVRSALPYLEWLVLTA